MNRIRFTSTLWSFTLLTLAVSIVAPRITFSQPSIRFAAVGDFGDTPPNSGSVATLIQSWAPDFVITVGDNNYTNPTPAPPNHYAAWDGAVGQYYHQFIKYPAGSGSNWAGSGSVTNRFFPSLGNHDWDAGIAGWYDYFELLNNERYYDFVEGPVHFFVIDSDIDEPDGITSGSVQGQWLQTELAVSTSPWKIVYFHHPPYSSGANHGNTPALQWPFQAWGATAVMAGHDHTYERILKNGFPYFVDGFGGRSLYAFNAVPEPGSVVRYSANYGAMLIEANDDTITFRAYSIAGGAGGTLLDTYTIANSSQALTDSTFTETFDAFALDQRVGTNPGWYDNAAGPFVRASNGVGGSRGLDASATIFTWSAHPFNWNDPTFAKVTLQMDFESSSAAEFDDDRVGFVFGRPTTNSDSIFAVQVDNASRRLEGYWDGGTTLDRRPKIDTLLGIVANTWYRLRAQITKLSPTSARVDAWLILLNASGDSVSLAASGSIANTQALGVDSANHKYFTASTIYAAYKNHTGAAADADNAYLQISYASTTPPADPTGLGATAISSTQINLAWTDNSDDETRFTIERSTNGGGSFDSLASVGPNTAVFSHMGLTPSTEYCYRVKAANTFGSSGYTNVACATTLPPPPATTENIVPAGSVWKYLDTGTNLGTTWRTSSFDDALWAAGPAQLGYGDGDEGTVVNCGPSFPTCNSGNFITTYFRHSFSIADSSIYAGLTLRLLRDDGAVVYLNDLEVFRSNMPTGTITSSTLASSATADETAWFSTIVDPLNLRTGGNVLAVEIHQSSATSSDVSFDLQLIGSIVQNSPFRETFEGFTIPSSLNAHPEWRDGSGGPTVNTGIGVNGSNGLTNADSIFTWEAIPFGWNASSFQGAVFQMDFQSSPAAPFLDDDRIGWMITNTTAASVNFFGVQVDPIAANTTQNIETYWDNQSNANVRDTIVNLTGLLQATTWYRLRLEVTKLGATAARLDVLLTQLDASGNPVRVVATGSVPNTSLLPVADQPHTKYFTGSLSYPAFKNFTVIAGNADNPFMQDNLNVPLPIQLASFTASVVSASSVRLDWITLTETNNYGFEVQKSAEAMSGYATIPNSFIPGHGTTLEPQTYSFTDNAATAGTWYYRLKQIDLDGTIHYTDGVQVSVLTDVEEDGSLPKEFALEQNYPNPFNPVTSIEFHLPKTTDVTLKIYNILGSEVLTLLSGAKMARGVHHVDVDATPLASGLYFYRMTTPEFSQIRKMIVLK